MPLIVFFEENGSEYSVNAEVGLSLMEAARNQDVPGIEAECGGSCTCATCHVYIGDEWLPFTGIAQVMERDLLTYIEDARKGSRLSCQVIISEEMDGMIVGLPPSQGFG